MSTDSVVARLDRQVAGALQERNLAGGRLLVVAVSGGPDSMAMLLALSRLRGELGLQLHGAHLDHGLRGEASKADARYVAGSFRRLGIGLTSERADVPTFQRKHRLSLEKAARDVRYAFLARVAVEQQADAIALGHTSDDQAETVLMHIIRGSGLTGLRAMETSSRRTIDGKDVLLFRPLLRSSRQDTGEYCAALNLEPRLDRSNLSTEMKRNRLRIELLPMLEEYNPAVREALIRLSRNAARDMEYMDTQVDSVWGDAARQDRGRVALNRAVFDRLAPSLQCHLLRRAVAIVMGDLAEIEQNHIDSMARLTRGPAGRTLDLPRGIRFSVGYQEATIASAESDLCPLPPLKGEHPLKIPGETLTPGWRITATVKARDPSKGFDCSSVPRTPMLAGKLNAREANGPGGAPWYGPDGLKARFSRESLGGRLTVRGRRQGDRFQPLGMSGHKKLKDFMVDARIPRQWRDRVPLVVSPEGIAWVVGWRIAEWARAGEKEGRQLEIRFVPEAG